MRSKMSTRASWPARTSLAACKVLVLKWSAKALGRIPTNRRTPTPIKIVFAGENTCQMRLMVEIPRDHVLEHTRPTPSPSVSESA